MNIPFFISLLLGLQVLYWIVGRYSSENITCTEDYFFAGKSVSFFPLMMTFLGTQVGGGVILGAAEEAFLFGWPVILYPLGTVFGLIMLGLGFGKRLARMPVNTVAQIFSVVYRSTLLRRIAALLSVVSLFMILVAQIIASSKFLVSIGCTSSLLFIAFWAVVIVYTVQGGLKAVISTDIVQAAFFSLIFLGSFCYVIYQNPSMAILSLSIAPFACVSSKLCGWLLMPLLFMLIEQDMGQRCFSGASPKIVSKAAFVAGICTLVVCVIPIFFGAWARSVSLCVPPGGSVLMSAIAATTTPLIASMVGCAVLAAIISTAASLINAISSNIANDFSVRLLQKDNIMTIVRWSTACISLLAIVCAFYCNNVVDVLIQSYELSVSCLFVPICMALFMKQCSAISAWISLISGALGFFCIYTSSLPQEITTLVGSLCGYGLGEVIELCMQSKKKSIV